MNPIGRTLGEFVLKSQLGEGGQGTVYLADQPLLGREAAVKVFSPSLPSQLEFRQRFLREARLASSVDHPFAAHIYSFGAEPDGLLWIAMERVKGTPLDVWLRTQGPIPLLRFVPLMERLCEVVHQLHQQGIIHRDLKPANVMVISRAGRLMPKLLDLGIARLEREGDSGEAAAIPLCFPSLASAVILESGENETTRTLARPISPSMPPPAGDGTSSELIRSLSAGLTLSADDAVMGSPAFMSPEAWSAPRSAGPASDIYSLGALAFQALTGQTPFARKSTRELSEAHRLEPPPSLGSAFPPDLGAVIQKALAKRAEDRYPDALALAEAFKRASGAVEGSGLPQLDPDLREMLIQSAPRPLAECVSYLETAQQPKQALLALYRLRHVSVQWLAILAMAAQARMGGLTGTPRTLALLNRLRDGIPDDNEWWELCRELCMPFKSVAQAHLIPELVQLCTSEEKAPYRQALEPLLALNVSGTESESELGLRLTTVLPALEKWLRALLFTTESTLAFSTHGAGARWSGIRRPVRQSPMTLDPGLPSDRLFLVDPQGASVLALWPLAQAIEPSPGATEECFLLEGSARHGAKLVARPPGFEKHDEEVWPWFDEKLVDLHTQRSGEGVSGEAPYRGLSSFTAADARNFFGRERAAEAFANRLRQQPLLAVVGPSGSGKSSFVQAGVVPLLSPEWRVLTLRPGPTPLRTLVEGLTGVSSMTLTRADLLCAPQALGEQLRAAAQSVNGRILLVVDQFEELVTLCADPDEQLAYAEAIALAARAEDDSVRVVVTLRDDFLIRVQSLAPLRDRVAQGLQLLSTPSREELLRILREPARKAGYAFEDPALPEEMVQSVEHLTGALALLSFTATRLWELRDTELRALTRKAYQALGGVGGALAHHAEATLSSLSEHARPLVREIFRHLVTAEGTRAVLTRGQVLEILGSSAASEQVLEALISARLLVASEGGTGHPDRVEVVHEALLLSWPRLVKWQKEDAENARLRDQLRAAARQWDERGRKAGLLWRGEALLEYRLWRSRYPSGLTQSEAAFGQASLREEARGQRLRRGLLAAALLTLVAGLALVTQAYRRANRASIDAVRRLAENHLEQGRLAFLAGDTARGLLFASRAFSEGLDNPGVRHLLGQGMFEVSGTVAVLAGHTGFVSGVALSADGATVATASMDKTVKLWRSSDGALGSTLSFESAVTAITANAEGTLFAVGTNAGKVWTVDFGGKRRLSFDLVPARSPQTLLHWVSALSFSPDGRLLAATNQEGPIKVWDARSGALVQTLHPPSTHTSLAFTGDGRTLVSAPGRFSQGTPDTGVSVWDVASGRRRVLVAHEKYVGALALSPDGQLLATADASGAVVLWRTRVWTALASFQAHAGLIKDVAFSPDSQTLLTGGADTTVRLWNVASHKQLLVLRGHRGPVRIAHFDKLGSRILTASEDGTARLWRSDSGQPLWTYSGHSRMVTDAALSARGDRLVTASLEPDARLWRTDLSLQAGSVHPTERPFSIAAGRRSTRALSVSAGRITLVDLATGQLLGSHPLPEPPRMVDWPVGEQTAATDDRGTVQLWSLPGLEPRGRIAAHPGNLTALQFSDDGKSLLTVGEERVAKLWDVGTLTSRRTFQPLGPSATGALSPDGETVAIGDVDGRVSFFDARTGALRLSFSAHTSMVTSLLFSPDNTRLMTASFDRSAAVWGVRTGTREALLPEHPAPVACAMFSPNQELALTSTQEGQIRLWETRTWTMIQDFSAGAGAAAAAFDATGDHIVTAFGPDGALNRWPVLATRLTPSEVARYLRCNVPFELQDRQVVPSPVDRRACR